MLTTKLFFLGGVGMAVCLMPLEAQMQRRANLTGGGNGAYGKCTIEVVVDGAADVEVRGDRATLRDLNGQQPQWRRFECTGAMPANPQNFRFAGVDGRGRQELVRDPSSGGSAVVRIQDRDNGAEAYTFDLTWGRGGNSQQRGVPADGGYRLGDQRGPAGDRPRYDQRDNRPDVRRLSADDTARACQDAVRQQAAERFHTPNVAFRRIAVEDNPGGRDSIRGVVDVRRGYDRDEAYRFNCAVNLESGQIRGVEIEPIDGVWRDRSREAVGGGNSRAVEGCERAVDEQIRRSGYQHVDFLSIRVDDAPGRNDRVAGNARADRQRGSDSFGFSCRVDMESGTVRSVDVQRR